jgi:heme exporter protein D
MTMFDSHSLNFIYGHDYDYVWLTHSLNFIYGHDYDYVWLTHSLNFVIVMAIDKV